MKGLRRVTLFAAGVAIFLWASICTAEVMDPFRFFHPYLRLRGEYNDNLNLSQDQAISDFITTISPGLRVRYEGGGSRLEMDYSLGWNIYSTHTDLNYLSHQGRLNAQYAVNPRLFFRLNDYLLRSREGVEAYTVTTAEGVREGGSSLMGGGLYLRNTVEPSLEYRSGKDSTTTIGYRNMIYRVTEGTAEESTENSAFGRLTYWFDIRNGISLEYTFSNARFERRPDWIGHGVNAGYRYRFNPRTLVLAQYGYLARNVDEPGIDYRVHSTAVGLEHSFSPTLSGRGQVGWFWQSVEIGQSFNGPSYNLTLNQKLSKTDFTLALEGGFREAYFTAENLGFSKYHQGRIGVNHRVMERMSLGLTGSVGREEYTNPDRKDRVWGLTGQVSYRPLKWLLLSLEASHQDRDSDAELRSYKENRVILSLSGEF